jgi:deoxyuridine 5'-triphosphate nucleotidohydrolase
LSVDEGRDRDPRGAQGEACIGYFAGVLAGGAALGEAGADALPRWARELLASTGLELPAWATRPELDLLAEEAAFRSAFTRGYVDRAGTVPDPARGELVVRVVRPRAAWFEEALVAALGGAASASASWLSWSGAAALDLLGRVYGQAPDGSLSPDLARPKHRRRYEAWCSAIAGLASSGRAPGVLSVSRLEPSAPLPSKVRISDSGYDVWLLAERKRVGQVVLYGTGLAVEPPSGWYFDVVARSSLIKTGYIVANSVGVIDRAYRGEIMVPLLKVDAGCPDLELPARAVQLVPRPIVHFPVVDVAVLSSTGRGALGFGSSG